MPRLRPLVLAVATSLGAPGVAQAVVEAYGVRLGPDAIVVDVPYSMGTHHEHVTRVEGSVRVDPQALRLEGGRLVFPIAAFQSDDAERECHLRESLGLDYRRSRFPREHVCDARNQLPASGPDAVAYPNIVLELGSGRASAGGKAEIAGELTVHGVTRSVPLVLDVSRSDGGMLRVRGSVPLRLSEFGITVKSAKVLFLTISTGAEVTVRIDALLEPPRPAAR